MSTRYERRGIAAWLTIARPEARNALSREVVAGLRAGVARALAAGVRAIVLGGAGEVFSAGADLKERRGMTLDETRQFLDELNRLVDEIAAAPVLTLAALGGPALGGGMELALACDVRLATSAAQLGLTEVRVGILPGAGGTWRLARLVGLARAKELILLGRRIDAARALEIGLVSQVVAPGELETAVAAVLGELEGCAPVSVARAKQALDAGFALPPAEAAAVERRAYEGTLATDDRQEGLRAFAEKRPPRFQGR